MSKKKINNTWDIKKTSKTELIITRIFLIILGVMLLLMSLYFIILIPLGLLSFYFAHVYKKELKRRKSIIETPVELVKKPEVVIEKPVRETVKVTDIDGSVRELSIYLTLDQSNRVLVAEGGKTYHTHLNCFKNWKPEMTESFEGWKIMKKSEALANNMRYCSFCKELDNYEDDDLDELEEYEPEYEDWEE